MISIQLVQKLKSDVILLKMDSGDVWFAEASVNGTAFKFLMDNGARKSVMSSKCFFIHSRNVLTTIVQY